VRARERGSVATAPTPSRSTLQTRRGGFGFAWKSEEPDSPISHGGSGPEGRPAWPGLTHSAGWPRLPVMSAVSEPAARIWTEAEILALPDDGYLHEVVNGELVMSPKDRSS